MIRPYRIARSGRGLAPRSPGGARPTPLRAGLFGLSVAVLAGLSSACHESLTQVDSRVVAPSTRPALDIAAGLPRLTDLVADETRASGHAVLARWDDSWNAAVNEGTRLRAEIYRSADTRDLAFDTTSVWSAIESVGCHDHGNRRRCTCTAARPFRPAGGGAKSARRGRERPAWGRRDGRGAVVAAVFGRAAPDDAEDGRTRPCGEGRGCPCRTRRRVVRSVLPRPRAGPAADGVGALGG